MKRFRGTWNFTSVVLVNTVPQSNPSNNGGNGRNQLIINEVMNNSKNFTNSNLAFCNLIEKDMLFRSLYKKNLMNMLRFLKLRIL